LVVLAFDGRKPSKTKEHENATRRRADIDTVSKAMEELDAARKQLDEASLDDVEFGKL
jgi:hypothetical protein